VLEKAVLLAVAASVCTATSSVCQRLGARSVESQGFDLALIFRLVRRPIWLLGLVAMIAGFGFQVAALRFGELALVQPILCLELLFVFAYMAVLGSRPVRRRDWLAAIAMSGGLGLFLLAASPSGGRLHASASLWWLAGLACAAVVLLALVAAFGLGRLPGAAPARRAAVLGAATGVAWGFVAAVIKELSSHFSDGAAATFSSWSLYVLVGAGAGTLLLASHALAAGPLAASQPGFTILDPLTAALLGVFLFAERIGTSPVSLAGEALGLALLVGGVSALSHSHLIDGEDGTPAAPPASRHTPARVQQGAH
jgi:drug/metabolite transporter (DMT)-like permease